MDSAISSWIHLLRCPTCKGTLSYSDDCARLVCEGCSGAFPVINGIPRFVPNEAYTESFGYQWNKFAKVQLDSYNGTAFSWERFNSITGWMPDDLRGKLILDAGCGSGRFTEVALGCGARVVALDMSSAVDACKGNVTLEPHLVCQASLFDLPFAKESFDYVFSIGVLQHTPAPQRAIEALVEMVRPGGQIGLWIYELNWKSLVGTLGFKYALRPITKRLSRDKQQQLVEALVAVFWPIIKWSKRRGKVGKVIMRLLPVASAHLFDVHLREDDLRTWILLDTFDMYTPEYDRPQRYEKIERILLRNGFENVRRHQHGAISITGTKKVPSVE